MEKKRPSPLQLNPLKQGRKSLSGLAREKC